MQTSYVGIDVSKDKLDWCIKLKEKELHHTSHNDETGILETMHWITENTIDTTPLIVIESTGSYHWLVCLLLKDQDFDVRLINPLITKKYQNASIRDAKSDKVDAARLADIGRLENDLPPFFDTRETLASKRYQSLLYKLQTTKQQLQRAFNSAEEATNIIDVVIDISAVENALEALEIAIKALKKIIETTEDDLTNDLAKISGVSKFQAVVLATAVSGRKFQNRDQLTAFFGIDVRARQSGQWRGSSHLSKRGNPFYRKVLFQLGWSLWRHNPVYAEYYNKLKDEGKHYFTILIAIARKFLRFFFAHFLTPSYN